ncbi:MAG: hypothetical protein HEP71_13525 [Roseivirga sp.]|nr:hypothetical protein [Roseivirga sp.]
MKVVLSSLRYAGVVLFAVCFTWGIHELTHWFVAIALGYDAVMTLNTVYLQSGEYQQDWHWILVSAVGPLITIGQACLVYRWLIKKGWNPNLYPFLLLTLYTRLLAGVMNLFNLNDEGRISHFLGIGDFTLSIVVSAFLGVLVYKVSKQHKPGWRYQLFTIILIMIFSSILILGDQALDIVLLPL